MTDKQQGNEGSMASQFGLDEDWSSLVSSKEPNRAVDAILNEPPSDQELEEAYSQDMADMMAYLNGESTPAVVASKPAPAADVPATPNPKKGVAPAPAQQPKAEPKKKDPGLRRFELLQEVRIENRDKHLGMDQNAIEKEARKRLHAEIDAGKVEDPMLRDYDPGEYVLNSNPDFYQPVIEGILNRKTINEINGDAGAGKTTLLVQMAVALATGTPLFGAFRVARKGITVFFTEDPDSVEMLVAAWSLRLGENMRDWIKVFRRPADLMEPAKLRVQKARIMSFANGRPVNMVVFDSKMFHLSVAHNNGVAMDENSNTDQQLITTAGHHFASNLDSAGIFIPHVSKGQLATGNYNLESRGGSSAKGAVYKTFSLVREKIASGQGNKVMKDTGYTVFSVGKARQGGLKTNFKLKGIQVPVFAGDVIEKKRQKYEDCFEPGQEPEMPEFIKIDLSDHVWIFEQSVFDMDAGREPDENFSEDERRAAHTYTPLQHAAYQLVRSQPHGIMSYKYLVDTLATTVFKDNGEPYSREGCRAAISKMTELGHLKRDVNPESPRDPYYTCSDSAPPEMGSCAGVKQNY